MAMLGVATASMVFASALFTWRSRKHAQKAEREVTQIHMIVNSQRDHMMAQIEQLKEMIRGAGYAVPAPPSRDDDEVHRDQNRDEA